MSHLIWTPAALAHLERLRRFLEARNEDAAGRALAAIGTAVSELEQFPEIGSLTGRLPGHRNLFVRFGTGGYVVRYLIRGEYVLILWVRHQRERPRP